MLTLATCFARHFSTLASHTFIPVSWSFTWEGSNIVIACYISEEFPDAIKAWKDSLELDPVNPDAHTSTRI